ncbi:DUF5336 domain-containing protein [Streptomyces sp. NRRL F-5126]|uniref:DUF5336 domain-containing protein n=1 Tax=Streptomyces sp. NRRL F-5126 TaxID=1463857 RepID=UPI00099D1F15|nr:DUF5336 domain-containing protein [Streptomyces sp. NRRL F-5126]
MNIRSLTRGDGVVIGAAVVLFIASFLDVVSANGFGSNAWNNLGLTMSMYVGGVIGAALLVLSRSSAQPRKVMGLDMRQFGVAFTVFAAWTALWTFIDYTDRGAGLVIGLIAALVLAFGAVATPLLPALQAPLAPAPKPQPQQPYGAGFAGGQGYGYPGGGQQPYGAQGHGYGAQAAGAAPATGGGAPEFAPFWFAVPVARPLYGEDGSPSPIAELAPGTWYLAVEQHGAGLVAQTQDGRRGVLQDTTGIQRG